MLSPSRITLNWNELHNSMMTASFHNFTFFYYLKFYLLFFILFKFFFAIYFSFRFIVRYLYHRRSRYATLQNQKKKKKFHYHRIRHGLFAIQFFNYIETNVKSVSLFGILKLTTTTTTTKMKR